MDCRTILLLGLIGLNPALAHPESEQNEGQELYQSLCATCHGVEGMGDGAGVPENTLRPRPFSAAAFKFDTDADWQRGTDADLANVIKFGTAAYGGSALMPPWPGLPDDELAALVGHVRSFRQAD